LLWNDSVKPSPFVAVLLGALREKGWVVGTNLRVEDRITLEGYGGYTESLTELIKANVDLIVAFGSTAVFAAAKATKEIPIVMHIGVDPVEAGLVSSLSRPGGNLTGVATQSTGLNSKRLQLLKELNPALASVGVVLAPNVGNSVYRRDSEAAARALNLRVRFGEARSPEDLDAVLAGLAKAGVGAFYVTPSSMLQAHSARVVEAIGKHRLPAVYGAERYVSAGGLMIYSASANKAFVRTAGYVDRILRGARAGELPIEQATDLDLTVNLRSAKTLGLTVPPSILVRADRVIE
jgi:putative ABC transport system substrate-binding protein